MKKYRFKELKIVKYRNRNNYYLKAYLTLADRPNDVICIIPIYDRNDWIDITKKHLSGQESPKQDIKYKDLLAPFYGDFIEVPSKWGPLYHKFTIDDYELGHCLKEDIGQAERNENGDVIVYKSIKIFTPSKDYIYETKEYEWKPEERAQYYYNYCFFRITELQEPLSNKDFYADEYEEAENDDPYNSYDENDWWWAITDGMCGEYRRGADWDLLSEALGY